MLHLLSSKIVTHVYLRQVTIEQHMFTVPAASAQLIITSMNFEP